MRINNRRGYTWKAWVLLIPLLCSTLVSISRTMDYRHHATDVIAGALVGIAASWFSYRQYYPVCHLAAPPAGASRCELICQPVTAPQSYKPYSPRIPHTDSQSTSLPLHNKQTRRSSSEHLEPDAYLSGHEGGRGHLSSSGAYKNPYEGYPPSRPEETSVLVREEQRLSQERMGITGEQAETVQR